MKFIASYFLPPIKQKTVPQTKVDGESNYMIGHPGLGCDDEGFIEYNIVYCVGGTKCNLFESHSTHNY